MKNKNIIILTYPRTGGNVLDNLLLSNFYLNGRSINYHTEFYAGYSPFEKNIYNSRQWQDDNIQFAEINETTIKDWEKYISKKYADKKSNFLCRIHDPNEHFFYVKNSFFILLYRTDILDWFLSKIIAGRTGVFQYRNKHKIPAGIFIDPTENDIRREMTRLSDFSKFYRNPR